LTRWVVKYPTTPDPGKTWNVLLFGHTSQEWRKKNSYWTIFAKIPDLQNWDNIQIIWEWNLYEYTVIDRIIVAPKYVNWEYMKYQSGQFLTLMWCYPLWTDKNRLMIFAKLKE
jgi:sortase (surface protein transpeptidase)